MLVQVDAPFERVLAQDRSRLMEGAANDRDRIAKLQPVRIEQDVLAVPQMKIKNCHAQLLGREREVSQPSRPKQVRRSPTIAAVATKRDQNIIYVVLI
jgi:hypothetical protein